MVASIRNHFNEQFTLASYELFKENINKPFGEIPFRVAETPVFVPAPLKKQLLEASEEILTQLKDPALLALTKKAIPDEWNLEGQGKHPHFFCLDFGISKNPDGQYKPHLIELQGFPTLFGFQPFLAEQYQSVFNISKELSPYLNNFDEVSYWNLLREVLIGPHLPEEVILMDVAIEHQKTAIDFYLTQEKTGIELVSFENLKRESNKLYYLKGDKRIPIKRIYNRLIFDEIKENPILCKQFELLKGNLDVEWVTHPNWFYQISKYTLPFLQSKYVPKTQFLSEVATLPKDLNNYVLKPLFSFAGKGVVFNVTEADVAEIKDPENWIIQEKVDYAPVIEWPGGASKVEIRLMYVWPENGSPQLCMNLARMSKGEMIGVNHTKNQDWVGGTVALFSK